MDRQPDLFDGTEWAPPAPIDFHAPLLDIMTKEEWGRYRRHWRLLPLHVPAGPKRQPADPTS